jgi:2-polyprenyl-3-methyl-5-hydroxy-6-metoxy-1,4-benzoquinol methylase
MANEIANETRERAQKSRGASDAAIYEMVKRASKARGIGGGTAVDLGCGTGTLNGALRESLKRYIGVDAVRYDGFPSDAEFVEADLNAAVIPLANGVADAVFAVETIEHLENPRALVREMVRIAKPKGWIVVTTPNQLSALSLATLFFKKRFSAFQDVHYPAHITALLETDLLRIADESKLTDVAIEHSQSGRIVFTALHYPRFVSAMFPRLCSDNLLLIGRTP